MNRRILLIMLCCALTLNCVSAQTNTSDNKAETTSFWNNCFVSAGVGAQVYFGDHDKQISFGDRIAPALDIAVGKWFTPKVGVRLMYSGLKAKGATRWGMAHSTGEQVPEWGSGMHYSKFNLSNLHADVLLNCSNWFCGENENRPWNISPYVGLGWAHVGGTPKADGLSGNAGLLTAYRLNSKLNLNLDIRGTLLKDGMDGEKGDAKLDGLLTVTIGISYTFK